MNETASAIPDSVSTSSPKDSIARLESVSRLFGGFAALRQVTVDFAPGRC